MAKRLFLAGIMQETNGFSPIPLAPDAFDGMQWDPAIERTPRSDLDLLGYGAVLHGTGTHGFKVVPSLFAAATPAAPMRQSDWLAMRTRVVADLRAAMPVDAVFLFLHGAMAAQDEPDCEGDLITAVREVVGGSVPIAAEYDLHGNLSAAMVAGADYTLACRLYPHTDHAERSLAAVALLARHCAGELAPTTCALKLRLAGIFPTDVEPIASTVAAQRAAEARAEVLCASIFHGFAYADAADTGAAVVVTTNGDASLARQVAEALAERFTVAGVATPVRGADIVSALDLAERATCFPTVIADRADNAGGGAAADATFLLRAVLDRDMQGVAMALFWDPVAVMLASRAGVGARLPLRIGGKVGPLSGDPVDLEVEVLSVRDDVRQAWFGVGTPQLSIGLSVAVRARGIVLILAIERQQVFSRHVFLDHGIDPAAMRTVIVQSTQHFHTDFAPLAASIVYCDGPGTVTSDYAALPYERLPRPFWPVDPAPVAPPVILFETVQ